MESDPELQLLYLAVVDHGRAKVNVAKILHYDGENISLSSTQRDICHVITCDDSLEHLQDRFNSGKRHCENLVDTGF